VPGGKWHAEGTIGWNLRAAHDVVALADQDLPGALGVHGARRRALEHDAAGDDPAADSGAVVAAERDRRRASHRRRSQRERAQRDATSHRSHALSIARHQVMRESLSAGGGLS
jgi:hypothetical protein